MKAYASITQMEDIGIIAGTFIKMSFDCYDSDGVPINLGTTDASFGCSFSYYGNEGTPLFIISGTPVVGEGNENKMVINVSSSYTVNLNDCCLSYQPFITIADNTIRPAQGRIIVKKAIPMIE